MKIEALRFFLFGDPQIVPDLYEVLLNHAAASRLGAGQGRERPVVLSPEAWLHAVGFERDEGLLPYQENARMGYRLLTEFFTFPAKFQFVELRRRAGGWNRRSGRSWRAKVSGTNARSSFSADKTLKGLEQGVDTETFRLGCTPVVNLFEKTAEPIPLLPHLSEYRIVADRMTPQAVEVYAVTQVTTADATENRVDAVSGVLRAWIIRKGHVATDLLVRSRGGVRWRKTTRGPKSICRW